MPYDQGVNSQLSTSRCWTQNAMWFPDNMTAGTPRTFLTTTMLIPRSTTNDRGGGEGARSSYTSGRPCEIAGRYVRRVGCEITLAGQGTENPGQANQQIEELKEKLENTQAQLDDERRKDDGDDDDGDDDDGGGGDDNGDDNGVDGGVDGDDGDSDGDRNKDRDRDRGLRFAYSVQDLNAKLSSLQQETESLRKEVLPCPSLLPIIAS
eukprot:194292-Hanusia_phi.AAC.1